MTRAGVPRAAAEVMSGGAGTGHSAQAIVPADTGHPGHGVPAYGRHVRGVDRLGAMLLYPLSPYALSPRVPGRSHGVSWLLGSSASDMDGGRREIVDAAESWEQPVARASVSRHDPTAAIGRFVHPTSDADLPPGVQRTLRFTCGSLPLDRTLTVPPSARPIDRSCLRYVASRVQVLGFGERGTGLWVEGRGKDPVAIVHTDRIAVVEDVSVLCYRRLSVRAADARLSVRYVPDAHGSLSGPILWLRHRIRGDVRGDLPWQGLRPVGSARVPDAWHGVADAVVDEAGKAGAAMLFGLAPATADGFPRGALVALTASELIVLAEPDDPPAGAAWPQLLVMPRRLLQSARPDDDRLVLRAGGVDRSIRLGKCFSEAAAELVECAGPVRAGDPATA